MGWQDRIAVDSAVLVGKPVVKGTRLAVEFVIDLMAQGWTEADVLKNYPGLTHEDVLACLAYAGERLRSEKVYPLEVQAVRLLANENFPAAAVDALRTAGHDVAWVRTDAPGSDDRKVLARAVAEGRVLLTFDKDFGELAFRAGLPATCGVVLFRISMGSPEGVARRAVAVLGSRTDWPGHFSVVEEHRVRLTPLPPSSNGSA